MDYFLQSYLHKTNVHTPQETRSFQKTEDLPLAHLAQSDCNNNMKSVSIRKEQNKNRKSTIKREESDVTELENGASQNIINLYHCISIYDSSFQCSSPL